MIPVMLLLKRRFPESTKRDCMNPFTRQKMKAMTTVSKGTARPRMESFIILKNILPSFCIL